MVVNVLNPVEGAFDPNYKDTFVTLLKEVKAIGGNLNVVAVRGRRPWLQGCHNRQNSVPNKWGEMELNKCHN